MSYNTDDHLVALLYEISRDHISVAKLVEIIENDSEANDFELTDNVRAELCARLAKKLRRET